MWNVFRNKVGDHDRAIITSTGQGVASLVLAHGGYASELGMSALVRSFPGAYINAQPPRGGKFEDLLGR